MNIVLCLKSRVAKYISLRIVLLTDVRKYAERAYDFKINWILKYLHYKPVKTFNWAIIDMDFKCVKYWNRFASKLYPRTLSLACKNGQLDNVKFIVKTFPPDQEQLDEMLIEASGTGNLELIEYLVELGACAFGQIENPLSYAARSGCYKVVDYFIKLGVPVNTNGDLPLINACMNGNLEVIKLLIESKANPRARSSSAFAYASEHGLDVVSYMVEKRVNIHVEDNIAFVNAAKNGRFDVLKYLLKRGVKRLDVYVLEEVCENGQFDILKFLIAEKADPLANNNSPLQYAARGGHLNIVKYLVKKGADARAEKSAALRFAARRGHLEVVKFLLLKGAALTALKFDTIKQAIKSNSLPLVEFLLEKTAVMKENWVVLKAIKHSSVAIVKLLIGKISPSMETTAIRCGRLNILKYFVSIGHELIFKKDDVKAVALSGDIDLLEFMIGKCKPIYLETVAAPIAIVNNNRKFVKYLHRIGINMRDGATLTRARELGCFETLEFLNSIYNFQF